MKTKFTLLFLIFIKITVSFAQMTVKNGTTVYVIDEIVYVKGNIELTTVTDNITLRNEAQLIQGELAITTNTGLGYLSVFQEGDANAYHYNYWSSPVGNTTNTVINNPFTLSLLRDGDTTSASFGNLTAFIGDLEGTWSPLTLSTKWLYTFAGTSWTLIRETDNINSGVGFIHKGTDNAGSNNGVGATIQGQRYEFKGKPNSGDITIATTINEHYLLGNPYPSALDSDQFILNNAAIIKDNTLYFWDQWGASSHYSADYTGNYATYLSNGLGLGVAVAATTPLIGAGGNPTPKVPKRYMPIAQGFFIDAATTGNLLFKNSQRPKDVFGSVSFHDTYKESAAGEGSVFLKSSSIKRTTDSERLNYYLGDEMTFPTLVFNIEVNQLFNRHLMLILRPDANETVEIGREAKMYDDLSSDAFWVIDSVKYSIQSDAFSNDKKIPIGFKTDVDGAFKIAIEANEYDAPTTVYLYDKETENEYLLDAEKSISLMAGEYMDRFEIRFASSTLDLSENIFLNYTTYFNNDTKELIIDNPNNLQLKNVIIFDITGKEVFSKRKLHQRTQYRFFLQNLSSGIYIVKSEINNNQVSTKKVSVVKK